MAPLAALCGAGSIAVQSLRVGAWLRDVGGLNRSGVAQGLFCAALTFSADIPVSGIVADLLARRGIDLLVTMTARLVVNFLCMGAVMLGVGGPFLAVWLLHAMTDQVVALVYAPAFLSQWGIGRVIDRFPQLAMGYDPAGYRAGSGLLLALQLFALARFVLLRQRGPDSNSPPDK